MFFAHRCRRAGCEHPDYWSSASCNEESVARGMHVDGVDADAWAQTFGAGRASQLVRISCGSGYCPQCTKGCDWSPEVFEVDQYLGDGSEDPRFYAPGELTNGATHHAGRTYACCCDACKAAYALWSVS